MDEGMVTAHQVPDQSMEANMETAHEVTDGQAPWTPPDCGRHPDDEMEDEAVATRVPDDSGDSESGEPEEE
eukprot:709371-Amphidinium_carterae.1